LSLVNIFYRQHYVPTVAFQKEHTFVSGKHLQHLLVEIILYVTLLQ